VQWADRTGTTAWGDVGRSTPGWARDGVRPNRITHATYRAPDRCDRKREPRRDVRSSACDGVHCRKAGAGARVDPAVGSDVAFPCTQHARRTGPEGRGTRCSDAVLPTDGASGSAASRHASGRGSNGCDFRSPQLGSAAARGHEQLRARRCGNADRAAREAGGLGDADRRERRVRARRVRRFGGSGRIGERSEHHSVGASAG
jgi:hypothetical protein